VVPGEVCVESYGDYFTEYASHPEAKAAGPDGEQCMPWTKGVLGPREIVATMLVRVGKEANRLAEDPALVDDPEDRAVAYPELLCSGCGCQLAGRQQRWCSDACRKRVTRRRTRKQPRPSGPVWTGLRGEPMTRDGIIPAEGLRAAGVARVGA